MNTITTKIVRDGNSMAVRLPKTLLEMSGLTGTVQLEAKQGQITLRAAKTPRAGWAEQIAHVIATDPKATKPDPELTGWDITAADGLDDE